MPFFRRRERFERSDVPTPSPLRSVVSLLVIILVAFGMYLLVTTLWHRAHQVGGMRDRSLRSALNTKVSVTDPGESYTISDHAIVNVAIFMLADDGSLSQAQILSLDKTASTGTVVAFPLDTKLVVNDSIATLSALCLTDGASACITPLSTAANVAIHHSIVASPSFWEQIEQLKGYELLVVLSSAADILETITTDMSTSELIDLSTDVSAIGAESLRYIDAPTNPEQLEDGRTVSVVDQTQLGLELGILISNEPTDAPAEGEEQIETEG